MKSQNESQNENPVSKNPITGFDRIKACVSTIA